MMEWLFWQVGNLGPMAGQYSHFVNYAPHEQAYSHRRYKNEYHRCLGVLDRRLECRDYILGADYTIADMISWPWVLVAKAMGQPLDEFPNVTRWRAAIKDRPAVRRGVDLGKEFRRSSPPTEEERKVLFEQTAHTAGPSRQRHDGGRHRSAADGAPSRARIGSRRSTAPRSRPTRAPRPTNDGLGHGMDSSRRPRRRAD